MLQSDSRILKSTVQALVPEASLPLKRDSLHAQHYPLLCSNAEYLNTTSTTSSGISITTSFATTLEDLRSLIPLVPTEKFIAHVFKSTFFRPSNRRKLSLPPTQLGVVQNKKLASHEAALIVRSLCTASVTQTQPPLTYVPQVLTEDCLLIITLFYHTLSLNSCIFVR